MTSYLRVLAVGLLGVLLIGCVEPPATLPDANVRTDAPEIKGVDSAGNELKLSDYRGKVVLVDFWFDQCPPCRENHVHEKVLMQKYKDKPFIILGVNIDPSKETMVQSEKNQKMTWPSVWDDTWRLNSRAYSVTAVPTIFLVDHKGRMATKPFEGLPSSAQQKQLEKNIDRLLEEAEKDDAKIAAK